ncbi:MAG: glutamate-5-semialdehyde dehydrogenase [Bacteroidetes bacterium]|jgi:glutamate-5-semialdehyde dehydrogenase|nr:glutamate-5-semialdehyde dehydrogenase [Bacteroidota bacterium]
MDIKEMAKQAKQSAILLSAMPTEAKNKALAWIAEKMEARKSEIVEANKKDMAESEKNDLAAPLLKRLKFDEQKIEGVIEGIHSLIDLPDPVGETLSATELDKGLELYKVSCPIGLIGVIFESRPDALVQISTLCLKSGNGVLLKGGSEAFHTNRILTDIIHEATTETGIPNGWVQLLETRSDVNEMLKMDAFIDLIIPRGSNEFVKYIMDNSNIPVLGHADGICHVYIDQEADLDMAVSLTVDSKCQYVAVCNAAETLLVHEKTAADLLPMLKPQLDQYKVEIFGCNKTQQYIACKPATDESWKTEYLDYKLSVKVVSSMDDAIQHINTYGSGHTDSIITTNSKSADHFMNLVDSGNVLWNCSTRFSDGFRYGLGAEVGISTNKIHARGPVGLEGLLIYKWKLKGAGQTVAPYADGQKKFSFQHINKSFSI